MLHQLSDLAKYVLDPFGAVEDVLIHLHSILMLKGKLNNVDLHSMAMIASYYHQK